MNIKKIIVVPALAAFALALFSACNISVFPLETEADGPKFYILSENTLPVSGETLPEISFGRISIPSYLDIPQIVTRNGNLVSRSESHRWGEPLARAVARELSLRCSMHASAVKEKITSAGSARVQVVFERFDGELGGSAEISALYTLTFEKDAEMKTSRTFKTSVPVEAPSDYAAYVRALSRALDALAADIVFSLAVKN